MKNLIIIIIILSVFKNSYANTLTRSVQSNSIKHVKGLLRNGIDPNIKDKRDNTALIYASFNGNAEIVKTLLKYGANPNILDNANTSPLHLAIRQGNFEIAKLLIEGGADINSKDFMNSTPIMRAIRKKRTDIIEILIKNNADLDIKNKQKLNSYDLAFRSSNPLILSLLIKNLTQHEITKLKKLREVALQNKFNNSVLILDEKINILEMEKTKKINKISFNFSYLYNYQTEYINDYKEIPTFLKFPTPNKKETIIKYNNIKNINEESLEEKNIKLDDHFKKDLLLNIKANKKSKPSRSVEHSILAAIPAIKTINNKNIITDITVSKKPTIAPLNSVAEKKEAELINKTTSAKPKSLIKIIANDTEAATISTPNNPEPKIKNIAAILPIKNETSKEKIKSESLPEVRKQEEITKAEILATKEVQPTNNSKIEQSVIEKKAEDIRQNNIANYDISKNNINDITETSSIRTNEWNINTTSIPISTIDKHNLGHDRIFNRKFKYKTKEKSNRIIKKQKNKEIINERLKSGYYIQLGIFSNPKNANRYKLKASKIGNSIIKPGSLRNKKISKVMLGPYKSKLEAISIQKQKSFQDSFGKFTLIKLY